MNKQKRNTAPLPTAEQILASLTRNADSLRQYHVNKIGLFGSFLTHKATSRSDIDLLVAFEQVSFDSYMELKFYLEELFGRKVDLVIEDDLKPALRYILKDAAYAKVV